MAADRKHFRSSMQGVGFRIDSADLLCQYTTCRRRPASGSLGVIVAASEY